MKKKLTSILAVVLVLVLGYFGINLDLPEIPDTTISTTLATTAPTEATLPEESTAPIETTLPEDTTPWLDPQGSYTTKEDVALYIHIYGQLPENFMTKNEARELGWEGGGLDRFAPGMCIGGDKFGNYDGVRYRHPGSHLPRCQADRLQQ